MRRIERERLLFRYSNALEFGDFDTIAAILRAAEDDPALERMILEINSAYLTEQKQGQPHPNGKVREQKSMSALTLTRPRTHVPLTLAVTVCIAVVFTGLLIFNFYRGNLLPSAHFQTTEQDNVAIFLRWNEEVWNQGSVDVLPELITVDHVRHDAGMPQDIVGIDAIAQFVTGFRLAAPDFHCEVNQVVGVGADVWAQTLCTGTQSGDLYMPDGSVLPPSNAAFTMPTMARARFVDGKIAEIWVQYDNLGWMSAIGLIPPVSTLMTQEQNVAAVRALIDGTWNGSNMDIIDEVYAPSVRVHYPTTYPTTTSALRPVDLHAMFDMLHEAYPDLQMTIVTVTAQADLVIVHYQGRGTQDGTAMTPRGYTMQPTGLLQDWTGVYIFRFEEGRIVEEWWYWNNRFVGAVDYDTYP